MFRLSKLLEKLEDKLDARFKSWLARNKAKLPTRVPAVIVGWYFYGMFLNSLRLGIASTFHQTGEEIKSIWVLNPFKNWGAVFTGFGIVTTLVIVLIICLITKKGYIWFSGYKYTHDPRGFDILPDGTHGTSGFLTEKEMREFLELSPTDKTGGMILGKVKKHPDDPDAYALYAAHQMVAGDNNNLLCIGAPGSGKSRGFIIPFLMGCAKRGESAFITDAKGELFERLSPYFRQHGFYVKAVNFLDMEHSDGWNCLYGLDTQPQLVQTVANTIVQNTSGPKEANDFWSRAELNLLMALIHYVVNLRDANGNLLPIEQRGLGDVYRMIATRALRRSTASSKHCRRSIRRSIRTACFSRQRKTSGATSSLVSATGWRSSRAAWWIRSRATTMLTSCSPASGRVCTLSSFPRRTVRTDSCRRCSFRWLCRSFQTSRACNAQAVGCRCLQTSA